MRHYLPFLLIPAFVGLFYHQIPGYNVFIFTLLYLICDQVIYRNSGAEIRMHRIVLFLSSLMFSVHASGLAAWTIALSFSLLVSSQTGIHDRNYLWHWISFPILWMQRLDFGWKRLRKNLPQNSEKRGKSILVNFLLVAVVLGIFLILYSSGSELVARELSPVLQRLGQLLARFFEHIDFSLLFLLILAILFAIHLVPFRFIFPLETSAYENIKTRLQPGFFSTAILFLGLAVALLTWVISLEIQFVWFGFAWEGQLLKGFVHEGTYLLIIAVLISVGIVLFVSSNMGQASDNQALWLRRLMLVWLILNLLLVVSVGIRTGYYISYFGLAYKRIGLYFFLVLCIIILSITAQIVYRKKGIAYLMGNTVRSAYLLVLLMSFFNWDIIIARYNTEHYKSAYIYVPFLENLRNESLPYLQQNEMQLHEMYLAQKQRFPFVTTNEFERYQYESIIQNRTREFIQEYQKRSFLSRNFDDDRAFHALTRTQ